MTTPAAFRLFAHLYPRWGTKAFALASMMPGLEATAPAVADGPALRKHVVSVVCRLFIWLPSEHRDDLVSTAYDQLLRRRAYEAQQKAEQAATIGRVWGEGS